MLLAPALRIATHRVIATAVLLQLLGQPFCRPLALALGHVRLEQLVELLHKKPKLRQRLLLP
jgi:hypothetical protein